jgi:hypothetical protein
MKQADVFHIIGWIDSSLDMLRAYEGGLNGAEVRIRSLLTVVRQELSRDLIENTVTDDPLADLDRSPALDGSDAVSDAVESVWRDH